MYGIVQYEMGKGITWEEQDKRLSEIKDTKEFILALLEHNPNMQYDVFSKRYSIHEDDVGYIESMLIDRFASDEEKERYQQEFDAKLEAMQGM